MPNMDPYVTARTMAQGVCQQIVNRLPQSVNRPHSLLSLWLFWQDRDGYSFSDFEICYGEVNVYIKYFVGEVVHASVASVPLDTLSELGEGDFEAWFSSARISI